MKAKVASIELGDGFHSVRIRVRVRIKARVRVRDNVDLT